MNRVFESMGTVVSLAGSDIDLRPVFAVCENRFSLYDPSSELSLVATGALPLIDASLELREAYARALEWRTITGGAFTPHRPDGVVDLNGIVKALAMDAAAAELSGNWILSVGGDVLAHGPGEVLGITDPFARTQLLTSIRMRAGVCAVATSGIAERGDHIWGHSREFAQVTVMTDDIVTADVLATAIVAGGRETLDAMTRDWPIDVLTVDREGDIRMTPGMREAMHALQNSG